MHGYSNFQKFKEKHQKIITTENQLKRLLNELFSNFNDSKSILFRMMVGHICSFFTRQNGSNRTPAKNEFEEFLKLIEIKRTNLENLW